MIKWLNARKLQTKITLWYTVFALFPMILITIYLYLYIERLMVDSLERNLDSQVTKIEQDLNDRTGNYYTISNLLYMDEALWSYLMADYSEQGYEDLYLYVDGLFSNIRMLYPDISSLSVLSTNHTLPRDDYYFYVLEDEEASAFCQNLQQVGNIMQIRRNTKGEICFTRLMNRYETGKYRNFLEIRVQQPVMEQMLESSDEDITVVLTDAQDMILISNRDDLAEKSLQDLDLTRQVIREAQTDHCGRLLLFTDARVFDAPVQRLTLQILLIFTASSGLAFLAIARYSSHFQKNVEKVMHGASAISAGDLSYKIPYLGEDEIGMIANSINTLGAQIQENIEEAYKKELNRQISELNQLQEQVNPHFLYNALSSISSMALNNNDPETSQAIVYLADFYRISLNKGKQELAIREELKLLESYMNIQRVRFGDGIVLEYSLDENLLDHRVMKLTLQPIVENAIHHGRTDDSDIFHILIRLYRDGDKTVLEVVDDGRGIPPEKMMELQDSLDHSVGGYGLRNVNIRLRLQYGPQYGISLESEEGFGTKVRIELP